MDITLAVVHLARVVRVLTFWCKQKPEVLVNYNISVITALCEIASPVHFAQTATKFKGVICKLDFLI